MRSTTPTAKLPSSERLAETDSKEFVFEETTWTSSLLISSASRFILELPAETSTEFSNKWRWTGGERLYSIRSGENILTYTDTKNVRYLYVNIQWQSLLYKNDQKSLYNIKANILDNGSDKPKYKDNRVSYRNNWDRCKDLAAARKRYFQK